MRKAVGLAALQRYDQKEAAGPRQCHADGDPMVQMPRALPKCSDPSGWVMHPTESLPKSSTSGLR
jgi:hypothetical protein